MNGAELAAYPVLLACAVGVYRLGRREAARAARGFCATRLAFQGALLGVVAGVGWRAVQAGALATPWGPASAAVAAVGVAALIALDVADVARAALRPTSGAC